MGNGAAFRQAGRCCKPHNVFRRPFYRLRPSENESARIIS
ncbi:hypothetical protein HMPREF9123_2484 [Neisseria bacilliformis ATCC BAA-1200]|uniref:Uncharacterized protein n=1 Tax=Neisseria bacilliformis ATCC BAA-1200 TaxID=888742 RepID=F2BFH7_9NEIS|nr:hypothetical protein HMPREF9123_2484 [Neisseria bacilliformis ATCC BAA-1200]